MVRDYIVKTACLLMLIGFTTGIIAQVELMKPGISFMSEAFWLQLIDLHAWATTISLIAICMSTISIIRHRITLEQWAVWLGFSAVPVLFGLYMHLMQINARVENNYLTDTTYLTACRHAYGTAGLLAALGGLSALKKMKFENLSLKTSFGFALLITTCGIALSILQASLGVFGMPRGYIDYPIGFAQLQFYSSVAAIACFSLSIIYLFLLWRHSDEQIEKVEEVF